jgi:hypothetical protein
MPTYIIKKGNHYACPPLLKPLFFLKRVNISWQLILSSECWYPQTAIDKHGINKITGIAFGFNHHNNSIRLGFQPDFSRPGWLRLYAYWYHNGQRLSQELGTISATEEFTFSVWERKDGIFKLTVNNNRSLYYEHFLITKRSRLGYLLKPYFGGRSKSPWDMKIMVKRKN